MKSTTESGARHERHYSAAICLGVALACLGAMGCSHNGSDARDASNPPSSTDSSSMGTGGTTTSGTGDTTTSGTTTNSGTGGTSMSGSGTGTGTGTGGTNP